MLCYRSHWPDRHVLKVDDDSYVRIQAIAQVINGPTPISYWGLCNKDAPVLRNHTPGRRHRRGKVNVLKRQQQVEKQERNARWTIAWQDFGETHYPPYAIGAGYVLSPSTVACLVEQQSQWNQTGILPVEDAFVGILCRACHVSCQTSTRVKGEPTWEEHVGKFWILHHIARDGTKSAYTMEGIHQTYRALDGIQTK